MPGSTDTDVPGDSAPANAGGFEPVSSTVIWKSPETAVPPLSLTTCLMTISVAAWSSFVTVQVAEPPFGMTRFEQFE